MVDYETRERAIELGRKGMPVQEIAKRLGINRNSLVRWLESEDIEPVRMRGEPAQRTGLSLRNTPLALSIEDGVRKRLEEDDEARRGGTGLVG